MERLSRRAWWAFIVLCLIFAWFHARFSDYGMDGDAVAFMDIADALRAHHWSLAVNAYWNPLWPAVLAVAQSVAHPTRWHELVVYARVNVIVFAACIGAISFLARSLVALRRTRGLEGDGAAVSPVALRYAAVALLFFSFQRELTFWIMLSDALLLLWLLLAAALLVQIMVRSRWWLYALLGTALGLAYLTKSFAFLPSALLLLAVLVFGLTRRDASRSKITGGAVLAGAVFAALAGPYVVAISRQMGHVTTGESARLNYAFFVDETPRWHEWAHHDLGHAGGVFVHPELQLLQAPPVFSFRNHAVGTFPLWFDPAYFTAGLKPHVWLPGHVRRLLRVTQLAAFWLANHPEGWLLLLVLLVAGATLRRPARQMLPCLVIPGWALLMIGIYYPIDIQERYMTSMLLLLLVPLLAMLRRGPRDEGLVRVGNATAVLLALLALALDGREVLHLRRLVRFHGQYAGLYSPDIFGAAKGLDAMGVHPGDPVGCMGSLACYRDHYWARLAGVQILGEVEVPDGVPTDTAWQGFSNKDQVLAALRSQGIHVLVTAMPGVANPPRGWQQLESSVYFAYRVPDAT